MSPAVKELYVRNFETFTTTETIQKVFEEAINDKIKRLIKFFDYVIISFYKRAHAETALEKLQNADIDGSKIEIHWAKPVYGFLYRGNEFNNNFANLDQEEHASSPNDIAIGSINTGERPVLDFSPPNDASNVPETNLIAPAKLELMCQRYMWGQPIYKYENVSIAPRILWTCSVELPLVRIPLISVPQKIGPLNSWPCLSAHEAYVQASEKALRTLQKLRVVEDLIEEPFSAPPLYFAVPGMQNYTFDPPTQNCLVLPHVVAMYPLPLAMMPVQVGWPTI